MYAGLKYCIRCGKPLYGLFDTDMCVDCSKTLVTATDHTEQVSYESQYIPKPVIDDIRSEIVENQNVVIETLSFDKKHEFYNGKWAGLELALAIIDKHIKAVEE